MAKALWNIHAEAGLFAGMILFATTVLLLGCGTVEPGPSGVLPIDSVPDARMFALQVHPVLSNTCGTANCHGKSGPLMILPASTAFPSDSKPTGPQDLPEPFRSSYYSVIQHCDLRHPDSSPLLMWASDEQSSHPGGDVLTKQDLQLLLQWIRSGGAK